MPHLMVEYGGLNLPADTLNILHRTLLLSGLFEEEDLKIRLCPYAADTYLVGGSDGAAFVHLSLLLLEGRSESAKTELSRALGSAVAALTEGDVLIQISVDLRDMARATYTKLHR